MYNNLKKKEKIFNFSIHQNKLKNSGKNNLVGI